MTNDKECCPKFNLEKWDEKTHNWDEKKFIKESIPTLFHMPFPPMIGKKITKMMAMAEDAKAVSANKEDVLILFADPSPFKSEIYLSVTDNVSKANNEKISGKFISKVFDGPFNAVPKFIKELNEYLSKSDQKAKKYYIHYAYCPGCAKKARHNYMVLFAEI
ncbi:MAG: hydrolase [Patescibacteria group bacterium]